MGNHPAEMEEGLGLGRSSLRAKAKIDRAAAAVIFEPLLGRPTPWPGSIKALMRTFAVDWAAALLDRCPSVAATACCALKSTGARSMQPSVYQ